MKTTFLNKTLAILGLAIITILSSCQSTTPFTNTVRTQYNLDEGKLKKMQFYISSDISLQRGERGENSQELDEDGKLVVSSSASLDNILVDGKRVNIPSYRVAPGQKITISEKAQKFDHVKNSIEQPSIVCPAWLSHDKESNSTQMITTPDRDSLSYPMEVALVVEYYARSIK